MRYDIIGDVHGCHKELLELLNQLGYVHNDQGGKRKFKAPKNHQLVFSGDMINNGPDSVKVLKLIMKLVNKGIAQVVLGNHDWDVKRILQGKQPVTAKYRNVVRAIRRVSPSFAGEVVAFLSAQPTQLVLDDNVLVVHGAHRHGVSPKRSRQLALYGDIAGGANQWAFDYDGPFKTIVRGHSVVPEVTLIKSASGARVYNIDTGCASGGKLTALRLPAAEIVQVKAADAYVARNWRRIRRRCSSCRMLKAA